MVRRNEKSSFSFAKQITIKFKIDSYLKEKTRLFQSTWKYGNIIRVTENVNDDEIKLCQSWKRY